MELRYNVESPVDPLELAKALTMLDVVAEELRALQQRTFWMEGEYQHSDSEPHEEAIALARRIDQFLAEVTTE